jgi:DNA segregation ATPase FtsK/SpoIIIE, S-DNA-T family
MKNNLILEEFLAGATYPKKGDFPIIPLGELDDGKKKFLNMEDDPHIKVVGQTGYGKSNFLHNVILSLISRYSPDEVKLILSDEKRVELVEYKDLPHLIFPVLQTIENEAKAVKWLVKELDKRYENLQKSNTKNIAKHNTVSGDKMPYIFYIVDELADLLRGKKRSINRNLVLLLQAGRQVGIFVIAASSYNGYVMHSNLISANFVSSNVGFKLNSKTDARRFLLQGAEDLPVGEALCWFSGLKKLARVKVPIASEKFKKEIIRKASKKEKNKK